jgi:hypothetical protein
MFTRGHERPENELIQIVDLYSGLEDRQLTKQAIQKLLSLQWLVQFKAFAFIVIKAAPDIETKIADYIHDLDLVSQAKPQKSTNMLPPNIRLVGPTASQHSYGSFLDLLRHAQSEICLPMLITAPYEETVVILQQRSALGVRIRILLAYPQVAVAIRDGTVFQRAKDVIKTWSDIAQHNANIEVRVSHNIEDMYQLATSWTLDRKLLRYDFYVPPKERSLAGYLIEFDSRTEPDMKGLNIINLFQAHFDEAWKRARPTTFFLGALWRIKQHWQWGAGLVTALMVIPLGVSSIAGGIVISISATFFFNAIVSSWNMIRQGIRNLIN